jgi:hypothetical protein
MNRVCRLAGVALVLAGLSGCIVAPAGPPAYGYAPGYYGQEYYAPGYYAPGYAVYPPPVSVGLGFGFGDGFHHHWR